MRRVLSKLHTRDFKVSLMVNKPRFCMQNVYQTRHNSSMKLSLPTIDFTNVHSMNDFLDNPIIRSDSKIHVLQQFMKTNTLDINNVNSAFRVITSATSEQLLRSWIGLIMPAMQELYRKGHTECPPILYEAIHAAIVQKEIWKAECLFNLRKPLHLYYKPYQLIFMLNGAVASGNMRFADDVLALLYKVVARLLSDEWRTLLTCLITANQLDKVVHLLKLANGLSDKNALSDQRIWTSIIVHLKKISSKDCQFASTLMEQIMIFVNSSNDGQFNATLLSSLDNSEDMQKWIDKLQASGQSVHRSSINSLLQALVDCNQITEAKQLLENMHLQFSISPTSDEVAIVLHGLCNIGQKKEAYRLFEAMQQQYQITPDLKIFHIFASNYLRENDFLLQLGTSMLNEHKIQPDAAFVHTMVFLLCKAKELSKAIHLVVNSLESHNISLTYPTIELLLRSCQSKEEVLEVHDLQKKYFAHLGNNTNYYQLLLKKCMDVDLTDDARRIYFDLFDAAPSMLTTETRLQIITKYKEDKELIRKIYQDFLQNPDFYSDITTVTTTLLQNSPEFREELIALILSCTENDNCDETKRLIAKLLKYQRSSTTVLLLTQILKNEDMRFLDVDDTLRTILPDSGHKR